jgi:oligosaccharide repeat unit polymerase
VLLVTCLAIVANALQFFIGGTIPLFSKNPDQARLIAGKNGYLHIFSVLPGHLIPIGAFILMTGKNLKKNTKHILKGMIVVCFLLLSLWIARGLLLYPFLVVIALAYLLDEKFFQFKKIFMVIVILLLIVSGIKHLRGVIQYGESFDKTQKQLSTLKTENRLIGPLVTLYLTFTTNYEILNRYAITVPALAPHTDGRLIVNHLLSFVPGHGVPFTELDYQNALLKKQDKTLTLTSTCFGIPYLDFGMAGVILISVAIGLLHRAVWIMMQRKGSLLSTYFYGYLISMAVFLPFTFIYTQVSFIWFVISSFPLLLLCMSSMRGSSIMYTNNRIAEIIPVAANNAGVSD